MMGLSFLDMIPLFDIGWMHLAGAIVAMIVVFLVRLAFMRSFLSDLAGEKFSYGLVLKRLLIVMVISLVIVAGVGGLMYWLMSTNKITARWIPVVVALLVALIISIIYLLMLNQFVHSKRKVLWVLLWDYGVSAMIFFLLSLVGVAMSVYGMFAGGGVDVFSLIGSNMTNTQATDPGASLDTGVRASEQDNVATETVSIAPGFGSVDVSEEDDEDDAIFSGSEQSTGSLSFDIATIESVEIIDGVVSLSGSTNSTQEEAKISQDQAREDIQQTIIGNTSDRKSQLTTYVQTYVDSGLRLESSLMQKCQQTLFVGKSNDQKRGVLITHTNDSRTYMADMFVVFADNSKEKSNYMMEDKERGIATITDVSNKILLSYDIDALEKTGDIKVLDAMCGYAIYTDGLKKVQRTIMPTGLVTMSGVIIEKSN